MFADMFKEKVNIIPTKEGYRLSYKGDFLIDEKSVINKEDLQIASLQGYCFLKFKNDFVCTDNLIKTQDKVRVYFNYNEYE